MSSFRSGENTRIHKAWLGAVAICLCPWIAQASGTFIPPPTPKIFNDMPIEEKIALGRALFNGEDAPMKLPGEPCARCHSGAERLKRRDLIPIKDDLSGVIAKEHYKRYGKEGDEVTLKAIYYYMYSRWRLDR